MGSVGVGGGCVSVGMIGAVSVEIIVSVGGMGVKVDERGGVSEVVQPENTKNIRLRISVIDCFEDMVSSSWISNPDLSVN